VNSLSLDHPPSLADLCRETGLNGLYRTPGSAAVASDEAKTVLTLGETIAVLACAEKRTNLENVLCVGRAAGLAGDVFDNVSPENVLDLLLLETTLDNKTAGTVDGTAGTQFGEQELGDVLVGTFHPLANLGDVCEDGLLVSFTETLRGRNLVALDAVAGKVGMLRVEESEESVEKHVVLDGSCVVVRPNAGTLHHVALLNIVLFGSWCLLLSSITASGSELGLEIILDLFLAGLLLLLERSEVALGGSVLALLALLLLAGLLLLLLCVSFRPNSGW
jgi:hypothetical protein